MQPWEGWCCGGKMSSDSLVQVSKIFGVKSGMTRVYDESGNAVVVTVIQLIPNQVSQIKTKEKDGYEAIQVAYKQKREKLISKPVKGHLKKASLESENFTSFAEIKMAAPSPECLGKKTMLKDLKSGEYVDVCGVSKGKGFQGVMKRHGFSGGPASHGSMFHRRAGSIGNRATPARVFPEKKMPGHMGSERTTVQNLKVVDVNLEQGYLLIKGSIPGSKSTVIEIRNAIKKS